MKVVVNKEIGKIYDLFASLYVACNLDIYYKEVEEADISIDQDYKELMKKITDLLGEDIIKYKKYFTPTNIAYSLIDMEKLWELQDLDKYLNYIESKDNYSIQKSILSFIDSYGEHWVPTMNDEKFKNIVKDNNLLFKFLNNKPISSEEKWTIATIINDVDEFKNNFITLINEYNKKYTNFIKDYESDMDKYNDLLEKKMKDTGIDKNMPLFQLIDTKDIDTIYMIGSYFQAYTVFQRVRREEHNSFLLMGRHMDKVFSAKNRDDSVEKYVSIFKNLGDLNRYKFIKLLSEGEKYGQEIADELNITSATVSYHANNLLIANLLTMERYENKTYYSLNKDVLKSMIRFIQNDLEL